MVTRPTDGAAAFRSGPSAPSGRAATTMLREARGACSCCAAHGRHTGGWWPHPRQFGQACAQDWRTACTAGPAAHAHHVSHVSLVICCVCVCVCVCVVLSSYFVHYNDQMSEGVRMPSRRLGVLILRVLRGSALTKFPFASLDVPYLLRPRREQARRSRRGRASARRLRRRSALR